MPDSIAAWRRTAVRDIPIAEAPALVPREGVKRIREADYEGSGNLTARVYELTGEPLGLDLVQRWPPRPDTVFFYQRNYFAVVTWRRAERQELQKFVRELERLLAL